MLWSLRRNPERFGLSVVSDPKDRGAQKYYNKVSEDKQRLVVKTPGLIPTSLVVKT